MENNTAKEGLKIMIGVDFEGITDVVIFEEIYNDHPFFERNSAQLTAEVNAAIEGAIAAGATEIIVRDGHGGNQNCNPTLLHPKALYANGRKPGTPETMVIGIDSSYDALLFIGAHAMAGKKEGVLSHTMSRKVLDYKLNGISMGECPYNALYAGQFDVPVIFIEGDDITAQETEQFFGNIATVITKKAIGRTAALNRNPKAVCLEIREKVEQAVATLKRDLQNGTKPYTAAKVLKMEPPYKMEVWLSADKDGTEVDKYITATSDNLLEVMQQFWNNI